MVAVMNMLIGQEKVASQTDQWVDVVNPAT
jgi:hypothetical protein